jgi:hypothetical protein
MDKNVVQGNRRRRSWTGVTVCMIGALAVAKFTAWRLQNYTISLPSNVRVTPKNVLTEAVLEAGQSIDWSNRVLIRTEQVQDDEVRITILERSEPDIAHEKSDETYFEEARKHPDMEFVCKGRTIRVVNHVLWQRLLPSRRKSFSSNPNRTKALAAVLHSVERMPDNLIVAVDDSHAEYDVFVTPLPYATGSHSLYSVSRDLRRVHHYPGY